MADAEGADALPQDTPDTSFTARSLEEIEEDLEKLGYGKDEAGELVQRHMAAKSVLAADDPAGLFPIDSDAYVQRYKQMQLGGPLSAVKGTKGAPDGSSSASGSSTPLLVSSFAGLVPRRGSKAKKGRTTV